MTRGGKGSRHRIRRRVVAVAALLVLLLPAILLALLHVPAVQARLLAAALRRAEDASGVYLPVRGVAIDPLGGRIRLRGLGVAVPGERPFLETESAEAEVDLSDALRGRLHLRHLAVEGLRLDLAAPLPASRGPAATELPFLSAADVDRLRVEVVSVATGPLPEALRGVALSAGARGRITGDLRGGTLRLRADVPEIVVERPGGRRLLATADAAVAASAGGRVDVEAFHVQGEGFALSAFGSTGLAPDAPLAFRAELEAEPARLAPELGVSGALHLAAKAGGSRAAPAAEVALEGRGLAAAGFALSRLEAQARVGVGVLHLDSARADLAPGGRLDGAGRFDLSSGEGTWSLTAAGLPDTLLERVADAGTRRRWGIAGGALDATARVRHGRGDPLPLSVEAEASLSRGEATLATATGRLEARGPASLDLRVALLPSSPGERTAAGRAVAPSLAALASGRLEGGRLRFSVPDAAAAYAELRGLLPELVPEAPEGFDLGGTLRVEGRASGPLRVPRGSVEGTFAPARGGEVSLAATFDAARRSGEGRLSASGLDLGTLRAGATGLVSFDAGLRLAGPRREALVALDAAGLCLAAEVPLLDALHATLALDGPELSVVRLAAQAGAVPTPAGPAPARLDASGRLSPGAPLLDGDLDAALVVAGVPVEARAVVRSGVLSLDVPSAGPEGLRGTVAARLPLGALRELPAFAALPQDLPAGPLELTVDAPGLDSCALSPLLPEGAEVPSARGDLRLFATLGLADPLAGTAELEVAGASVESPAGRLALSGPARISLAGGKVALAPVTVAGEKTSFTVAASAELVPGAAPGAGLVGLVARLEAEARGRADAALLGPFLAGGTAKGEVEVDAAVSGPPDALEGRVALEAPGARLTWPLAYPTELKDPVLVASLAPGTVRLVRGEAVLNGGPLKLEGGWYEGVGATLRALFFDVRYRLAYGLASVLSGELTLDLVGDERRLSGDVTLERGLLERDVDLDREVLARVLAPPESPGTEESLLDTLALDVGVGTTSGIRIRNNVADLSASWSRLEVTGTARRPVVRGRVEVGRDGLVFAYGQTFRIDRGSVVYAGDPETDPRLDFVTTSSLQDPSIGLGSVDSDVFAERRSSPGASLESEQAASELAYGLAGYYGGQLASRLGAAFGRVSFAVRPLLLFGEADPTARLMLSRDFSPNVSLGVGIDLKNAQRQTWVVDVHGLRRLPPLSAQLFTEDSGRYGGTLQQRIELGGTIRKEDADEPLLAALRIKPPPGVSRRALSAATGLRKGSPAGRDALFEAEIDAEAFLRAKGWPEAQVTLRAAPARREGRVDVEAAVEAGPHVSVEFEGDRPPKATRSAVAGLYRSGLLEAAALGEMRLEVVRAFRARGHVHPEADVTAGGDDAERRVVVAVRAGDRTPILEVVFDGVEGRAAAALARRFATPLERSELAAGLPSADRRLLDGLSASGFPRARVLSRELPGDGRLLLRLEAGPPSLVDSVEVRGLPAASSADAPRLLRLGEGDVANADAVALSALSLEDELRAEGYPAARVRTLLSPATPEDPPRLAVLFDVEAGATARLGTVSLAGFSRTSEAWARRTAGLAEGSLFSREALDAARGALFSLGLFRSVRGEALPADGGRVDVVLTAEELPPFVLGYGIRWENERGFSAVVDAADRNLLGRGLVLGVRGLYDPEDRALRLFAGAPERVLGVGLDVWIERRRTFREGLYYGQRTDTTEASVQLSRSFGPSLSLRLYGRLKETRFLEDDPFFPIDLKVRFPYAGVQLVRDTREDPLLGNRGLLATLDVQASGDWLGSDFAYARAYGQVNTFRPLFRLGAGRVVWAQSLRAGYARAFQGQELIPDARFYAGGSYSVRGYPTESLGPRVDLGGTLYVTGGSTLLVVNEELRVPLHPRLLGVGFFDAGQVWESPGDFGTGLATSVGLGLRALTPLGVLRLDGAVPLDRRPGDPSFRVTFGFGNIF